MTDKKRKITEENREFNNSWTDKYFFVLHEKKTVCIICLESVAVLKEYNIKRHYISKHANKFDKYTGQLRNDKIIKSKAGLTGQQNLFKNVNKEQETATTASYEICYILAKHMKPFSDGNLVKECIEAAVNAICPEKNQHFRNISLSRFTVARRIDEMAENVMKSLEDRANNFESYSLCLDESTDLSDTAQLAIFIRGVDSRLNITEELLDLVSMKGTTTAEDLCCALEDVLAKKKIPISKLCGIATDGAPSMRGKRSGLTALLTEKLKTEFSVELFTCHCVIHIENLCAKTIEFRNVMQTVISTVNFIRSKALNHRQFKEFLEDLDTQYGDVIYFSEIRWLSRAKVLKRFLDILPEVKLFMDIKDKHVPQLNEDDWIQDLAFLVDITSHLSDLNVKMQGKNLLINEFLTHIKAFIAKLSLWRKQIKANNLINFPNLLARSNSVPKKYEDVLETLSSEFEERFSDFLSKEEQIRIFTSPFAVEIDTLPEELQMEIIDLQSNSDLKDAFKENSVIEFYKKYVSENNYPRMRQYACRILSLFASTYVCEQFFSLMKLTKTKNRTSLTDDHLKNSLILASTNIHPDVPKLIAQHQCQKSH